MEIRIHPIGYQLHLNRRYPVITHTHALALALALAHAHALALALALAHMSIPKQQPELVYVSITPGRLNDERLDIM